jgi:hypothetical protein
VQGRFFYFFTVIVPKASASVTLESRYYILHFFLALLTRAGLFSAISFGRAATRSTLFFSVLFSFSLAFFYF